MSRSNGPSNGFRKWGIAHSNTTFYGAESAERLLLAIPAMEEHGGRNVFQRLYRTFGAAFYGVRTIVFNLIILALLRIKRPENLKEYSPQQLGRLLGLDRAPEVKTLRRKLSALAECQAGV